MKLHSITPTTRPPVVDYLRFMLPRASDPLADHTEIYERLRRRVAAEMQGGSCANSHAKRDRYRYVFSIPLPGGSRATVRLGALDPVRQKGGISISLNPAKFQRGDAAYFHEVMERIVGRSYKSLLGRSLVNRIDFAVDIVHADLNRMLVSYSGAQQFTVFGKTVNSKGKVETYNFGSITSDYMTAVYSKDIERRHRAIKAIAKSGLRSEPLKANFIKQLERLHGAPPVVRVEVRGKKLNGMAPHELHKLENRFARFAFADLNAAGASLPKELQDVFISLCRDRGVKAALAHFKGTSDIRKVNAFWKTHQADWWRPEPMWKDACNALRRTGVFPASAFVAGRVDEQQQEGQSSGPSRGKTFRKPHETNAPVVFKRVGPGRQSARQVAAVRAQKTVNRLI